MFQNSIISEELSIYKFFKQLNFDLYLTKPQLQHLESVMKAMISTGYNGSPRGFENCCDIGKCPRVEKDMHQGEGYGICRAVHAEANALLNCSREQTIGADLYLTGINPDDNSIHRAKPCPICARTIIQAGINNVIMRQGEGADNYIILPAKELQWVLDGDACE